MLNICSNKKENKINQFIFFTDRHSFWKRQMTLFVEFEEERITSKMAPDGKAEAVPFFTIKRLARRVCS